MTSELETNIVAVERVKEYSETPTEVRKDVQICTITQFKIIMNNLLVP